MLIKSESSWWIPKPYMKKEVLKIHLEDIIAEPAFQQRRENLLRQMEDMIISKLAH
jgi:hypothetical protein